jgi:hypothetical protein
MKSIPASLLLLLLLGCCFKGTGFQIKRLHAGFLQVLLLTVHPHKLA